MSDQHPKQEGMASFQGRHCSCCGGDLQNEGHVKYCALFEQSLAVEHISGTQHFAQIKEREKVEAKTTRALVIPRGNEKR